MSATVILGGHWGDEGKGKVVDLIADRFDYNVRYSGGANAGHTVVNDRGSFALHQVPSGIFHDGVTAMLAAGVVVDPPALLAEMRSLEERGIDLNRFYISERAHLVLPYHKALDAALETRRGDAALGTTGKGIGPAYTDKAAREGIRVGEMRELEAFAARVRHGAELANLKLRHVYGAMTVDVDEIVAAAREWRAALVPHLCDVERELRAADRRGQAILLEGAQGALLDIEAGTYPFVTSSLAGSAGAAASSGLPPTSIHHVVAVLHAYMTRVGAGPFPTELSDSTGDRIRQQGREFGTTTGRPRRCGWFDAVATRQAVEANGATSLAVTKLDVLDGLGNVRLCVAYRLDGKPIDWVPANVEAAARVEPVYEDLPGWGGSTSDVRSWGELPGEARRYVERIQELMNVPVSIVSVGPARDQTLVLSDPLSP